MYKLAQMAKYIPKPHPYCFTRFLSRLLTTIDRTKVAYGNLRKASSKALKWVLSTKYGLELVGTYYMLRHDRTSYLNIKPNPIHT